MEQSFVRFGIVGTGRVFGYAHKPAYVNKFSTNLVAVAICDMDEGRANRAFGYYTKKYRELWDKTRKTGDPGAERYKYALDHLRVFTEYDTMLKEMEGVMDAVDICTHNNTHVPFAVKAMEHGYHACAEKPTGLNHVDAERVLEAEKRTGNLYQLSENQCYRKPIQTMRKVVQQGKLGKITHIRGGMGHFGPYKCYTMDEGGLPGFISPTVGGAGVCADLGIHGVAAAIWPIYEPGMRVLSCSTLSLERRRNPRKLSGTPYESLLDDYAHAKLKLSRPSTGDTVELEAFASWCGGVKSTKITGDIGSLKVGPVISTKGPMGVWHRPQFMRGVPKIYAPERDTYEPLRAHIRELQSFADRILAGQPSDTPGHFALALQQMISIQFFSNLMGKRVTLEEMYAWSDEIMAKYPETQQGITQVSLELLKGVDLL